MFGTKGHAFHQAKDAALAAQLEQREDQQFEKLQTDSIIAKYALPIIAVYIALGTAFFHYNEEGWEWADSAYFCAVTLTTVGYGDLHPESDASKMFAIGYILAGLSIVATSLGVLAGSLQGTLEGLTMKGKFTRTQRYVIQTVRSIVMVCLVTAIGATFVHFNEGFTWLDSVYWAVVTASTVGYGDVEILEESTRIFSTGYVLIATGVLATALSRFGAIIMDIEAERHVDAFVARGVSLGMLKDIKLDADGSDAIDRMEFLQYM